jgi:hypothetical protein
MFNNFHGIFLVAIFFIIKINVHKYEIIGSIIAICGSGLLLMDDSAKRSDG